jgi:hypothetical protein
VAGFVSGTNQRDDEKIELPHGEGKRRALFDGCRTPYLSLSNHQRSRCAESQSQPGVWASRKVKSYVAILKNSKSSG